MSGECIYEGYEPGRVIVVKKGRDKDRFMVIINSDGAFVWLADGDVRKTYKAKKKNIKHVAKTDKFIDNIHDILTNGKNADVRLRTELKNIKPEG